MDKIKIVVEGLERTGKTMIASIVANHLESMGFEVVVPNELESSIIKEYMKGFNWKYLDRKRQKIEICTQSVEEEK